MALTSPMLHSKEVQTEQEPTRKLFETESVTHHDYRMELVRPGPPAPTKVRLQPALLTELGSAQEWKSSKPRNLESAKGPGVT